MEVDEAAVWLDERSGPLEPRNIYGVTKLAAEGLCRVHHLTHALPCVILRTSRFFPEADDTHDDIDGANLKATEFLHRRLAVEDCADAHVAALARFLLSRIHACSLHERRSCGRLWAGFPR